MFKAPCSSYIYPQILQNLTTIPSTFLNKVRTLKFSLLLQTMILDEMLLRNVLEMEPVQFIPILSNHYHFTVHHVNQVISDGHTLKHGMEWDQMEWKGHVSTGYSSLLDIGMAFLMQRICCLRGSKFFPVRVPSKFSEIKRLLLPVHFIPWFKLCLSNVWM